MMLRRCGRCTCTTFVRDKTVRGRGDMTPEEVYGFLMAAAACELSTKAHRSSLLLPRERSCAPHKKQENYVALVD